MPQQKRVAAIHDISGFGRCSLTVALPILSACGIEAACLPTALLSTHTGGLEGWSFLDLTAEMERMMTHWAGLGLTFDGIYSGYLGSPAQVDMVSRFITRFKGPETLVLIDPAMGDSGALYTGFSPGFVGRMAGLCARADVIAPNITEAALMLGMPYQGGPYDRPYIESLLHGLLALGPRQAVLTGVWFDEDQLGAACIDRDGAISYTLAPKVPGLYHGTGDIYASVLMGALTAGRSLPQAIRMAVDFTHAAIARTYAAGTDPRFGVNFEAGIGRLAAMLGG